MSVLFADVAGSTELAARLDPERFREVMTAVYRAASDEIASLRGRTEKFAGDAVMAVFGLPHAHEDDALRAVRAGLQIRDRVERVGEELRLPAPLRVRVGVNTGPVVAGTAPAGEFLVSGTAVNMAARLQQAAEPGEVLVGDTTWQLTRHAASFGEQRTVEAKGFTEEVHACPVESLTSRSSRRTIPLVGRRLELDLLVRTVQRSAETSRAHLVTVVGEPGIGKSRLIQELRAAVPEHSEVLLGRASEFAEDVTFAPLVDLVRRRLAVGPEASTEELRARLHEVVEGCCDPGEAERVTAQLGLLLGIGEDARQQNPYRAAEIRSGMLSFLTGLARRAPVVLILEDLHLAQTALLELLEEVVRGARRIPLTVVAVGREDLLRTRPSWGAGLGDALVLRLEPLGFEDSKELAVAAGGETVDERVAQRVARDAGGNPFFIVETTGMLVHEADHHTHGHPPSTGLPPTVQAVVESRIDHLGDPGRALIRTASIFPGGAFHESKLALVADADTEVLGTLEDEELLVRDDDREGRWRFRHELLREVAYESLSKRERRRLHERVATSLAELDAESHAQEVAFHLEQAALAARDLDPTDTRAGRRAVEALRHAGDLARRRMESRGAIDLYERALALAGPGDGWGVEEARILAGAGEARYWLAEYASAEETLDRALEIGGEDPWTVSLAMRFAADIVLNIHGEPDRAEKMFEQAVGAARDLGDPWAVARTLLMAGWVPYWRRDHEGARERFEEALAIARDNPQEDWWAEARALNSLVSVVAPVGDAREALELAERALAIGRERGDPFTVAGSQENLGMALRRMWRLDEALAAADEAVRIYRDLGARWETASALGDRGTIRRLSGSLEAAEADLREALEICLELGERALVAWTAAELAAVLLLQDRADEARAVLGDPALPRDAVEGDSEVALLETAALLALGAGEEEEARRLAMEALSTIREGDLPNWTAAHVWWVGSLFGADLVGGPGVLEDARRHLESVHWQQALREPEVYAPVVGRG